MSNVLDLTDVMFSLKLDGPGSVGFCDKQFADFLFWGWRQRLQFQFLNAPIQLANSTMYSWFQRDAFQEQFMC